MLVKIAKFHYPVIILSFVLVLLTLTLVSAETTPEKFCGDSIVQSPNDHGEYEKCDDGGPTEKCTANCGQKLLGYAWATGAGWISLNDDNCNGINCDEGNCGAKYVDAGLIKDYIAAALPTVITPEEALIRICPVQTQDYYVQVNSQNQIQGWAWSDSFEWVCFGVTCAEVPIEIGGSIEPPSGQLAANLVFTDPAKPEVTGWAKIISLKDEGWISLSCQNQGSCGSINCSSFDGDKTLCEANGCQYNPEQGICSGYKIRLIQKDFDGTCSGSGEKCDPLTTDCEGDLYCCPSSETCVRKPRLTLSGWAWNANTDSSGVGWLWFDPKISTILPWLQTRFGDIYAQRGLTGQESPNYNATYRILANSDIVQFISAQGAGWWTINPYGPINLPRPETRYSNVLGKIDLNGLRCNFGAADFCINKYGQTVVNLNNQPFTSQQLLNGKIYYYNGDLEINNPLGLTFINGTNFENGAGTIIVNGDLLIKNNITYQSSSGLTNFRNLASVAWVVLGDLKIANNVPIGRDDQLVGNFIVIGNGLNQCNADPLIEVAGCGQIYSCCNFTIPASCDRSGCDLKRLTVAGLMMAKKFYFDRTYTEQTEAPIQGSEVIIYDGRLLANTPPGLGDFAKALPVWRSGIFSE